MSSSISEAEWQKRKESVSISNDDMNMLVMNFLSTEGYIDAARAFQKEADIAAGPSDEAADVRMHVRTAVEQGDLDGAIEQVNDLNPEILEENGTVFFHLQKQKLIEMIREGRIQEGLAFAQEFLAYKGEENEELLDELESAIALMAFEDPKASPMQDLMSPEQRQRTAGELNSAILCKNCQEDEPRLATLLRLLAWGEKKLGATVTFPRLPHTEPGAQDAPNPP